MVEAEAHFDLKGQKFYVPEKGKKLEIGGVQHYFTFTLNEVSSPKIGASAIESDSGAGAFIQSSSSHPMLTGLVKDKKIFLLTPDINTFIDNAIIAEALFIPEEQKIKAANQAFAQKHYDYFDGTVGDFIEKNKTLSLFKEKISGKLNSLKDMKSLHTVFAPVNYGMADLNPNFKIDNKKLIEEFIVDHIYDELKMPSESTKEVTLRGTATFKIENSSLEVQTSLLKSKVVKKAVICNNGIVYALDLPIITSNPTKVLPLTQDAAGLTEKDKIAEVTTRPSVLEVLDEKAKTSNWSSFPGLLKRAGFDQTLNRATPFTLFALDNDVINWIAQKLGYTRDLSDMGLEDLKYLLMHFVIFDAKLSPRNNDTSSGYVNSATVKRPSTVENKECLSWSRDNICLIRDGFVFAPEIKEATFENAYDPRGENGVLFNKTPVNGSIIYVNDIKKIDKESQSHLFITPILNEFPKKDELIKVLDFSKVPENNPVSKALLTLAKEVTKEEEKKQLAPSSRSFSDVMTGLMNEIRLDASHEESNSESEDEDWK